ncbi:glutathione S-transferase family protein [Curvivirga aplysinae]|uniref:glutathione S-transferase family protein n=1 Tax=Curvivirga aplysinae TaxID=2529852 RepID=UPI0012BC9CA7|nr:glutathione S-transferase family protein [Curvivirga aplysinae]MTI11408.1 glutathione S-transferase family protein [Curvivirga aplysinae]
MLILHTIPESLYCAKTRILLRYKGLKWAEVQPPGGYGSEEYKIHIPSGNLPASIDGDLKLADSEAIAEYLEENFPIPCALPKKIKIRAKVRELSRFHDTRLEPIVRKLFRIFEGAELVTNQIKAIDMQLNKRLNQLDQMLQDYLPLGYSNLCFANCGYAITFLWVEKLAQYIDLDLKFGENISTHKRHMETLPSIQEELLSYTPILEKFLAAEFS